jgi:hypothetical protein
MTNKKELLGLKVLNCVTFILMVLVNALANLLPLNGVTTGEVADSYQNLFAPAPITFSIWGLIYVLLAGFVLYQFGLFSKNSTNREDFIKEIGLYFAISSVANTVWIFAWHYHMIFISVILMIVILICLAVIAGKLSKEKFSTKEKLLVRLPFSIYFGWITVALIANITVLLVSLGWNGWGIPEQVWTVAVMIVGLLIGIATMLKNKDVAYGLAILWAYTGILIKHLSASGFQGEYPAVIATAIISMVILALAALFVAAANKKNSVKL